MKGEQEKVNGKSKHPGFIWVLTSASIMLLCPLLVMYFHYACAFYKCSLLEPIKAHQYDVITLVKSMIPPFDIFALKIYTGWFLFQFILMIILPSKKYYGTVTPGGNSMLYTCVNGLYAWIVTHVIFAIVAFRYFYFQNYSPTSTLENLIYEWIPYISPAIIFDYWRPLLLITNIYGYVGSVLFYLKAWLWPSTNDIKYSGSFIYDFFMGVELNPRLYGINSTFAKKIFGGIDLKLFLNGRVGIVGWTLINLSFACKQYELYGTVTNSMILLNILHAFYVLDFFIHEDWYLGTIDIIMDGVGFYLCWGDIVWLPFMYTLQGLYLVYNPVQLDWFTFTCIAILGFTGYYLFRATNWERTFFRKTKGEKPIPRPIMDIFLGKDKRKPTFIRAYYDSPKEKRIESLLLTSGWWGMSRHPNYIGDLMMSSAFCLCCGFQHLLPYFYIVYMLILLTFRTYRDDAKCSQKYGKETWEKYMKKVPYRIIPYIF